MSDLQNYPEWVQAHLDYYGSKVSMRVRNEWHQILIKEMGSNPETVLAGVKKMIRDCVKGWAEDHLKYLMDYCASNSGNCNRCKNNGLVTVPNYGPNKSLGSTFKVLCTCPRGHRKRLTYPLAATVTQWEEKHGPVPPEAERRVAQTEFAQV